MDKRKRAILLMAGCVVFLVTLLGGLTAAYVLWEAPPAMEQVQEAEASPAPVQESSPAPQESPIALANGRQSGVYTLLLVGNDDGNGNTDTIIVGRIDSNAHKMDFVSIPRDTLINTDWQLRKINAVYGGDISSGGNGIDALKAQLCRLMGFEVDCYAVVDLSVFMETVDALGGVYFDVPAAMDYEDASQNLYIHLQPGYQHLDGYEAMGLCRYRSGYTEGDIGRINMQHEFLKACAGQFISLGNIPNIGKVLDILSQGMQTDMTAANLAFFIRTALGCKSEDINFYTLPNTPALVQGYSYAVVDLWDWLPMVNSLLNPYDTEVGWGNVDIVYLSGDNFYGTAPLQGSWYYEKPKPAPVPAPAPTAAPEIKTGPVLPELPQFSFPPLPQSEKKPPEGALPA